MKISSLIFSIDDEDIQLCDINSIFKLTYSSYISGCSISIKNIIEANAYVLVSNNIFIVSIDLEGFNHVISIREDVMLKAQNYSKTIINLEIYLECNNQKVNYTLKAFIVNKSKNHFIVYAIKERKID